MEGRSSWRRKKASSPEGGNETAEPEPRRTTFAGRARGDRTSRRRDTRAACRRARKSSRVAAGRQSYARRQLRARARRRPALPSPRQQSTRSCHPSPCLSLYSKNSTTAANSGSSARARAPPFRPAETRPRRAGATLRATARGGGGRGCAENASSAMVAAAARRSFRLDSSVNADANPKFIRRASSASALASSSVLAGRAASMAPCATPSPVNRLHAPQDPRRGVAREAHAGSQPRVARPLHGGPPLLLVDRLARARVVRELLQPARAPRLRGPQRPGGGGRRPPPARWRSTRSAAPPVWTRDRTPRLGPGRPRSGRWYCRSGRRTASGTRVTSASAMGAAAALTYSLRSTSGTALDGLIAPSSHPTTLPAYSFMTASPWTRPPGHGEGVGHGAVLAPGPRQRALRVGLHRVRYLPQRAQELEVGRRARISARGVTARWRPRATARSGPRALRRHASRVNCPRARRGGAKQARAAVVIPGARVLVTEHR